ncbi:Mitochondrial carrier protein [Plasmodiophora brassicae]|uniref:Mitochondrial carrier protein n=1 Tax=Plasmodiophora brassicae TaxID=37360 RepID=A0A0G4IM88_PLABS|nr:hypothetical protein PBRA_005037 [Plasmodiophora brassicae]SPQ99306.1 unnamed protein product [Plasmodiophora brassicae]
MENARQRTPFEMESGAVHALLVSGVAGGAAGAFTDFVLFPLDTLKTRVQARDVARGSLKFYSGLASAMAGSFPSAAVFFAVYDTCRNKSYAMVAPQYHALASMGSASIANVAACAVRVPFEVVKQQLQAGMHSSTVECVKSIVRRDGVAGLYRGYMSTVLREVPFDALQFALWETLKVQYSNMEGGRTLTPLESGAMGAIAGSISAAATNPLDVVKTRLMTQGHKIVYNGFNDCIRKLWADEGLHGLTKGIFHRVAWIGLGGFLFFGAYETASQSITRSMDQ